jgi:hypothetical protein
MALPRIAEAISVESIFADDPVMHTSQFFRPQYPVYKPLPTRHLLDFIKKNSKSAHGFSWRDTKPNKHPLSAPARWCEDRSTGRQTGSDKVCSAAKTPLLGQLLDYLKQKR